MPSGGTTSATTTPRSCSPQVYPYLTLSKRLGHTSSAVTLDVYGHWLPEQDREAADIIARLLG